MAFKVGDIVKIKPELKNRPWFTTAELVIDGVEEAKNDSNYVYRLIPYNFSTTFYPRHLVHHDYLQFIDLRYLGNANFELYYDDIT